MKKISRRSFLSAMGIVGAAAALTACGGSSSSTAASSSAASTAGSTAAAGSAEKPADYPNASMSLVVGFNPGGDSDLNNRLMAQYVEPSFGQSIAVTNMAGSNSSVALTQYQSTPTDGYTILGTNSAALVNNYASGTCQYSYEDFEVIAVFGRAPGDMLFANKASGITSMEDLLEKSKANPTPSRWACPPAATPTSTLCCCSRPASRATSLTAAMVPIVSQLWWAATWMSASCRT